MANEQVFISYHTESSAETVHKICDILEQRGITCWYAPRNVTGDYASAIVNAIDCCRVFLVILNEKSNLSEDVRNEINCAFERVRRHEDITILPFRVDDSALSNAVKYYLGRIHIINGNIPPEIMRIHELADRVSVLLNILPEKRGVLSDKQHQTKHFCVTGTMVYADRNFVGRRKELDALHQGLSGPLNKIFLVGMGGIGKSEIAKTYCARFREEYDVILWVAFDGTIEKTLCNDFIFPIEGLERKNYPDDTDHSYFIRKLNVLKQISDRRLLLIIDNFDVKQDPDLEAFCSGSYSVIFTTRYHSITSGLPEIEISPMSDPAELTELFRTEYKRAGTATEDTAALFAFLNGHPLSIRLVAAVMQSNRRMNAKTMLDILARSDVQGENHDRRTTDLILGRLQTVFHLSDLSEEALAVLKVLALVPLSGITVEELFDWSGWTNYDIIDDLIQKSWIIHNPVSDEVHLHPIVARICREELQKDGSCCNQYIHQLTQTVKVTKNYSWQRMQQLTKYCETACAYLPDTHHLKQQLLIATGSVFMDTQNLEKSIAIFRTLLQEIEDAETRLFLYHKLSHIQVISGDAEGSINTAEEGYAFLQTLEIEKLSLDAKYMKKVLLQRIGEASREAGDYDKAIAYGEKAVAVCDEYVFIDQELSRGWALYHLASSLICAGRLDEAYGTLTKAQQLFEEISDVWSVAYCYVLFGKIKYQQKQYDIAMQYVENAWDIHMPHYGESSRTAADLLLDKGNILIAQGKHMEANNCFEKAAEIFHSLNLFQQERRAMALVVR